MSVDADASGFFRSEVDLLRKDGGFRSLIEEMEEPREPLRECADEVAGRSGGVRVEDASELAVAVDWSRPPTRRPFLRKMDEDEDEPWVGATCCGIGVVGSVRRVGRVG